MYLKMISNMLQFFIIVFLGSIELSTSTSYYQDVNLPRRTEFKYESGERWQNPKCFGHHQSPINIMRPSVISDSKVLVTLINYNRNMSFENISTNHETVSFHPNPGASPSLNIERTFGNRTIRSEYKLYHFHFHWNCTEHHIDDQRFALELHFVHYNPQFGNFSQAKLIEGGLSVLAVLFKLSDRDNEALNILFDMMKVQPTNSNSNRRAPYYSDLFPGTNVDVYHYNGSLTTPTCDESVYWNVISELNTVSLRQIVEFQRLHNFSIPMNCREPRWQNDRKIYRIKVNMTCTDGASTASAPFLFCAISALIVIIKGYATL